MSSKWAYIAYGMIWVSTAVAVSVGIYFSENWKCLFFYVYSFFNKRERK